MSPSKLTRRPLGWFIDARLPKPNTLLAEPEPMIVTTALVASVMARIRLPPSSLTKRIRPEG
jgi:hypothetical protein